MNTRLVVLGASMLSLAMLGACDQKQAEAPVVAADGKAQGEILTPSTSDEMPALDQLTSEAPIVAPKATNKADDASKDSKKGEDKDAKAEEKGEAAAEPAQTAAPAATPVEDHSMHEGH